MAGTKSGTGRDRVADAPASATGRAQPRGPADGGRPGGPALETWRLSRRKLSALRLPADSLREEPGDIESLGESIAQHGLLVPILIEPDGTVRAGSRRVRALRARLSAASPACGLPARLPVAGTAQAGDAAAEVECLVLPPGADPSVAQIVENIQRKDLTPIEEAKAYRALLKSTGWSKSRLAREVGVPPSRVGSRLNLLDAPLHVQAKVESGEASVSAVADAFSRRGRRGGRAVEVSERLRRGGAVRARHTPASVRVPVAALPEGVRAKVFRDRVEITVTLKDDTPDLARLACVSEAVRAPLAASAGAVLAALRAARTRALELEGLA